MEKTDEKYLQFPLYLIREMLTDKEKTINNIFKFGIYHYSTKFKYTIADASKNLLYYYWRKNDELTSYLSKSIDKYIKNEMLSIDTDYCGFNGKDFEPLDEMEQLEQIFKTDIEFKNSAIEFYQMQLSYKSMGITGNISYCLKVGKEIKKQIPTGEPMPMISKSLLFEYRDNAKTEFDLIQLVSYMAIKSIMGVKSYVKTNKKHILCRMFGYSSIKHLPAKMPKKIDVLFLKYSNRYHIDKIIQQLELNWNVITYSNNIRGMYITMSNKNTIEQLALIAERKKQKNRTDALKKQKQEAKEKALQQLKKEQQNNND